MRAVFVDLGSYSLKISLYKESGKNVLVEHLYEHFRKDIVLEYDAEFLLRFLQDQNLLHEKIIIFAPFYLTTHRQMIFPSKDRKKARQIIPFQLEDSLPYGINKSHFAVQFHEKEQLFGLVEVGFLDELQSFVKVFQEKKIKIHEFTTESAVIERTLQVQQRQSCCVLDIGHFSTKAYFFHEHRLVFIDSSPVGGYHLTKSISEKYGISLEEALQYKHQNSFFLTSEQKKISTTDQVTFSEVLEEAWINLFRDFKKFEMSYRTNVGISLEEIILIGGSSQIKNIDNFFIDQLSLPVNGLNLTRGFREDKTIVSTRSRVLPTIKSFYKGYFYMEGLLIKEKYLNFKTNLGLEGLSDRISLYSLGFVFVRMMIIAFLLFFYTASEKTQLESYKLTLNKRLVDYLKKEDFSYDKKEIDKYLSNPELLKKELDKELKILNEKIVLGKKEIEEKSFLNFSKLLNLKLNESNYLKNLKINSQKIEATFNLSNDEGLISSLDKIFKEKKMTKQEKEGFLKVEISL